MSETESPAATAKQEPQEATAKQEPQVALRVITESTTPEEVAAIVAVLASLGGEAPAPKKQRSLWATPSLRSAPSAAGAWRASGLPH